ncbi:unnamed protein product [Prunus armeniaca]
MSLNNLLIHISFLGMAFLYVEIVVEKAIIELVVRNPNIEPTKKRKVAKEKLPVRRRDGKEQSTRQQSIQLRQRKQASGSQGPSQSQASQVAQASQSQPS